MSNHLAYAHGRVTVASRPLPPQRVDGTFFPFLQLPGEVRNMIYTYASVENEHTHRFHIVERPGNGRRSPRHY